MMRQANEFDLMRLARAGRLSRRAVVRQLGAMGLASPVIAGILSACGGEKSKKAAAPRAQGTIAPPMTTIQQGVAPPKFYPLVQDPVALGKDARLKPLDNTNYETPLEAIEGVQEPSKLLFIRSNNPILDQEPGDWRLQVGGLVDQPLTLTYEDVRRFPTKTVAGFLECSGNSRSRFNPKTSGNQWGNGAVGSARWTGTPLVEMLNRAGVKASAVEVLGTGGDTEDFKRSIPLDVARDPDTLLVWEMNGEPLPKPNGGPVRLWVPGWGGIASIKWIAKLEAIDQPFNGPFQTERYILVSADDKQYGIVREMPVKSVIVAPLPNARVGRTGQTVRGFAWSGLGGITRVEVSVDGGGAWQDARLTQGGGARDWAHFEYAWVPTAAGMATLNSRATDSKGNVQPTAATWNKMGYLMNAIWQVPVEVS